jgi:hypothetical protein
LRISTNLKQKLNSHITTDHDVSNPFRIPEIAQTAWVEFPRDIVLLRLAYVETFLARIQIDNLRGVVVATVGGVLALRWGRVV